MPETAVTYSRRARLVACLLAACVVAIVVAALAKGAGAAGGDAASPSGPADITILSSTDTTITITWSPSHDNAGVVGYGFYVNLTLVDRASSRPYTFTGLACGTTFDLGIDAYDAAGNRSRRVWVVASTAACPRPAPPPAPVDRESPTAPSGLTATAAGHTSISLSWAGSSDNVGVVGYGVYSNGPLVGTTPAPGFTLSGLSCGSSYSFAVDAYDAAGNRSGRASVAASTSPCQEGAPPPSDTPPPPSPTEEPQPVPSPTPPPSGEPARHTSGMSADVLPPSTPLAMGIQTAGPASVSLGWSESSDNLGVAGYGVYANGIRVGSTNSTSFTIFALACATTYTFAVDAFDAAGNESAPIRISGSTAACPITNSPGVFVAPTGSDANLCTQALPCASFGRAYLVALPGQTVQVASGSYPYQLIAFDPAKSSSAHVVFQPAAGASVYLNMLDFGDQQNGVRSPQHITVRDLGIGYIRAWDGTSDVVWQNLRAKTFDVISSDNVRILGGDFGPCQTPAFQPCTPRLIGNNNVIDGASIHDVTSTNLPVYHVDGLFVRGCRGCSITRTKFWGNMITNIRVQDCCGQPQSQNLTLENNWFAAPLQGDGTSPRADAIDIDNPVPGLIIRNNSFSQNSGPTFGDGYHGGERVTGNLMMNFPCEPGVIFSYNLFIPFNAVDGWGATPCGPTDRVVTSFGYNSPGGFDYHLAAGSPAIDAGNVDDCPANDIDGDSRAGRCDAGSDQR